MELASMLAGERFSDRPASVCPIIGALLRAYNDNLDERRRKDLYRYAAEAVGTRGGYDLQRRRAEATLEWARSAYERRRGRLPSLRRGAAQPDADSGPELIAFHAVGSLGPRLHRRYKAGSWSDGAHERMLGLLDRLIEMGFEAELDPFPVPDQIPVEEAPVEEAPLEAPDYCLSISSM
jgi:hypothetical protein